jgi:hypothetical protein
MLVDIPAMANPDYNNYQSLMLNIDNNPIFSHPEGEERGVF